MTLRYVVDRTSESWLACRLGRRWCSERCVDFGQVVRSHYCGVPSDETRTVSHWSLGGRGTVKGSDTESEAMDLTVSIDDMLTRFLEPGVDTYNICHWTWRRGVLLLTRSRRTVAVGLSEWTVSVRARARGALSIFILRSVGGRLCSR
jgi:hypothetical protein